MFDAVKAKLAWRGALKQVQRRDVHPWTKGPAERRVLVVLPTGEEAREAWRFVKSLGLAGRRVIPIVLAGEVTTYVPAEYISHVIRLEDDDTNLVGLPKREFTQRVWKEQPDVALCLAPTFDIASAVLVGASPAPFRVGFYEDEADPFFDLMVTPSASSTSSYAALREALRRISPPVLALDPAAD
jgi:hypothetical protein